MNDVTASQDYDAVDYEWSFNQKVAIAITPKFSSLLSILGSSYIIYDNISNNDSRAVRLQHVRNRILIALSFTDLISSFAYFASTWAIPIDDEQDMSVFNLGNRRTCSLQGFMVHVGSLGAALYNACLSLYFLLSVKYSIRNEKLRKTAEPMFHFISIGFPVASGTYGILKNIFNPASSICYIAEYPLGCEKLDCIRGANAQKFRLYSTSPVLVLCLIVITVSMISLYKCVKRQEIAMSAYIKRWSTNKSTSRRSLSLPNNTAEKKTKNQKSAAKKSEKVFKQAQLYIGAFFLVWTPIVLQGILKKNNVNRITMFSARILALILIPLQGFFNAMIYVRYRPIEQFLNIARNLSRKLSEVFSPSVINSANGDDNSNHIDRSQQERQKEELQIQLAKEDDNNIILKNDSGDEFSHGIHDNDRTDDAAL